MSKKGMKRQEATQSGPGVSVISSNQGSHASQNVSTNQTAQSNAKDSRSGGKRNA
jgi:hypothetical protein